MTNVIYWNQLWQHVTEYGGKKTNLSDEIKEKFYDLIELVIVKKGDYFLTSDDLENEYTPLRSNYARRHYDEVRNHKRNKLEYFISKHNLYEYNQEIIVSIEDVDELEYMFIVVLYYSFNYKSIIDVGVWLDAHNSTLGLNKDGSSNYKEFLQVLVNYKELFLEDVYNGVVSVLGGNYLINADVYNTNIHIEQNNLTQSQINTVEVTEEYHNYNETVQNFYPDQEKEVEVKVINLNDFILHNCVSSFKLMLKKLRKKNIIDDENVWLKEPLDLIALFGLFRSLDWCVGMERKDVQSLIMFGDFLSTYFRVKSSTIGGYMKNKPINSAVKSRGKLFKEVFVSSNWDQLKKIYPELAK